MKTYLDSILFGVFFIDTTCSGDSNFTKHAEKLAVYPYNIANNIDECECQQQCDKDSRCNGYTIDDNTEICSLSRCNNPDLIFTSSTNAIFYSKKIPTSHLLCVPVTTGSADTTLNSTTPTKKQTTLEQATLVTSHIPMDEATNVTKLTTMASFFYSESIMIQIGIK